ncbi:DotU family type IV/VI secretion system protein [Cloacibacillus sp. An23]|uniref:DotU family type IV/VI secretion system protein n=1 Tax=Cloacibacillus sp. An23 TaxID=1965591 RepID=UPI000B39418C|nr:DotU family type IV/VI secretion system protein [Cloacibacillus sp. An23]OUO93841.1 hypothetical protein B5F39_06580 [Cloacibacillus sp. An23]
MNGLCERFAPLMAETLHYAGAPEGLETPLAEANARIVELAGRERSAVSPGESQSAAGRRALEQARLAVYAWADEQMMSSPRADAASWAAVSLQFRYFGTSEAGRLFYQELDKCLDSCGAPRRVRGVPRDGAEESAAGDMTCAELDGGAEGSWRELDLAERFDAAASRGCGEGFEAIRVFALCLLFGFRGALYGDASLLARVRSSCRALFDDEPEPEAPPARRLPKYGLAVAERAAYVALPLLVCLVFALYCAGVLANAPFHGVP